MKKMVELYGCFVGHKNGDVFLCGKGLHKYFDFPDDVSKIYLTISTKDLGKKSYKCRLMGFWCDDLRISLSNGKHEHETMPLITGEFIADLVGVKKDFYVKLYYEA